MTSIAGEANYVIYKPTTDACLAQWAKC